jgi:uncharacterized protein (TIGR00251 family)
MNIEVRLTPRASRDEIAGWRGDQLLVRVTAPPADDRANRALRRLLAKRLGIAVGGVEIVRGRRARTKLVRVDAEASEVRRRLPPPGASGPGG